MATAFLVVTVSAALALIGSGTVFVGISLLFAGLLAQFSPDPTVACVCVLLALSGPLIARAALALSGPFFAGSVPRSVVVLAVVAGYLFVFESAHTAPFVERVLTASAPISLLAIAGLLGDFLMTGAVFAALAFIFIALIELPFAWVFGEHGARSIRWLPGMRPVFLAFFLGISIGQIGSYLGDVLESAQDRVLVGSEGAHGG